MSQESVFSRTSYIFILQICKQIFLTKKSQPWGVLVFLLELTQKYSEEARITLTDGLNSILQDAFTSILFMLKDKIKEGSISKLLLLSYSKRIAKMGWPKEYKRLGKHNIYRI